MILQGNQHLWFSVLFSWRGGLLKRDLLEYSQSDVIEAFNFTSRYPDDLLNIVNNFFDSIVNCIYPSELQLNRANV